MKMKFGIVWAAGRARVGSRMAPRRNPQTQRSIFWPKRVPAGRIRGAILDQKSIKTDLKIDVDWPIDLDYGLLQREYREKVVQLVEHGDLQSDNTLLEVLFHEGGNVEQAAARLAIETVLTDTTPY